MADFYSEDTTVYSDGSSVTDATLVTGSAGYFDAGFVSDPGYSISPVVTFDDPSLVYGNDAVPVVVTDVYSPDPFVDFGVVAVADPYAV